MQTGWVKSVHENRSIKHTSICNNSKRTSEEKFTYMYHHVTRLQLSKYTYKSRMTNTFL